MDDLKEKLSKWLELDYILPEDIPNIDLYMDQITTFMDTELKNSTRFQGDKIFTKTMINNYSKNDEDSNKISKDMIEELNNNLMLSGLEEAKGPGLKIVLEDGGEAFSGEVVDDFMRLLRTIHDDDMIKVINELKAAGAEAISINNQRIIYNTEIYCGGQFLRMNGVKIPAPFYVNVIGDPEKMENQIMRDGSYIKTLMNRGIKVQITKSDDITMPAYISDMNSKYMEPNTK